jgi:hypothetical protein
MTQAASAVPYSWVDWTTADGVSATGSILGVDVAFSGPINPAAQVDGAGTNFWAVSPSTYTSAEVDNGPPDSDIIRITGGAGSGTFSVTFAQAVVDPVLALLSVGQPGLGVQYVFGDEDVEILNAGPGFFGNGALAELAGNIIQGNEGHGIIRLNGVFTTLDWTVPTSEFWHGFQIGVAGLAAVAVPEPATLALIGLGLAAVGMARRRGRAGKQDSRA